MGDVEDGCFWSDDDIEILLRYSAEVADLRDPADLARFIADLREVFSARPSSVSLEIINWCNGGDHVGTEQDGRQREVLAVENRIHRLADQPEPHA